MIEKIIELISLKDFKQLKSILADTNNADISEWLDELPNEDVAIIFRLLPKDEAADLFSYMEADTQEKLVNLLSDKEIADIVSNLFVDDAADIVSEMPDNIVNRILKNADASKRKVINEILKYPEESAGSIMNTEYIAIPKGYTVKETFDYIRSVGMKKETVYVTYITDETRHLVGVTTVKELLMHSYEEIVDDFMEENVIHVKTTTDQEEVARMFDHYDFIVMPVVDNDERLVGIVTIDDAMEVLTDEQEEDFEIMSAMAPSEDEYFKEPVFVQYKNRIVWLLFLMISSLFTGIIISNYEEAFKAFPILVSFIPMIMDTGGNCGSQSSTVIIRGMATDEILLKDWFKAWWKEIRIAIMCGATLAVVNGIRIFIQYQDMSLAVVLGVTLIFTVMLAKSLGCVLPMIAKAFKQDPAYMASPLITTIADAVSLMIYFSIAKIILGI